MDDLENNTVVETAAADSIKTKEGAKSDFISRMQGKKGDSHNHLSAVFATAEKNVHAAPDKSASNKATIAMKPSEASPKTATLKEEIASLFGEDTKEISEEIIDRATTLFEAALNERISAETDAIYEHAFEVVEEMVSEQVAEISENIDDYLNYAVNEWVEENKLAIESTLKFAQLESFYEGLKTLMGEHNLDLPEDSVNVVEALTAELDEAKAALDEQIQKNIDNQKIIDEARRDQAFDEIAEGLAATQVEKLRTLCEGLDYADLAEFTKKVTTIKEHHFKAASASTEIMSEQTAPEQKKPVVSSAPMSRYMDAISKNVKFS